MKAQLFILLSLVVINSSCELETDLATRTSIQSVNAANGNFLDGLPTDAYSEQRCLRVIATHSLRAFGSPQPLREQASESSLKLLPSRRYEIEASGEALTDVDSPGRSQISFAFHTQTGRVTGSLKTYFYDGSIMEVPFDTVAHIHFEGSSINLRLNTNKSNYYTGTDAIEFPFGELIIVLPRTPIAQFGMKVYSEIGL